MEFFKLAMIRKVSWRIAPKLRKIKEGHSVGVIYWEIARIS